MDLQYVLLLDGECNDAGKDALRSVGKILNDWLNRKTRQEKRDFFSGDSGDEEVNVYHSQDFARGKLSWKSLNTDELICTKIELVQSVSKGVDFVTAVTVLYRSGATVSIRIALGRRAKSEILSPVDNTHVKPPAFVDKLLNLAGMKWSSHGSAVDKTYLKIRDRAELEFLKTSLSNNRALPVLLLDTVNKERLQFAKDAQSTFAGLAHVVCIPSSPFRLELNELFPNFAIPFGGARLVWPNEDARALLFSIDDLNNAEKAFEILRKFLYQTSAVTRGKDRLWTSAKARSDKFHDEARERAFKEQLELSRGSRGSEELVDLLSEENLRLENSVKSLRSEIEERDFEILRLEELLRNSENNLQAILSVRNSPATKPVLDIDSLYMDDADDFEELFIQLETATDGAIVFTQNALAFWQESGKPEPRKMRKALIDLAKAAIDWRNADRKVGIGLDRWLGDRLGLRVPLKDDELVAKGKHLFAYDGVATRDRSAHVKVKDATDPSHVARIYFEVDAHRSRFVVDAVGLKLYGI